MDQMNYKSILFTFCFLFSAQFVWSQFGISARLQNNANKTWDTNYQSAADTSATILGKSYEYGLNYWFRLKEYRIEFLPEISYAKATSNDLGSGLEVSAHERTSFYFNVNTQIYPLDFLGDCNCPTFSKDGNTFAKGFYWLISPGISYHKLSSEFKPGSTLTVEERTITSFRFGLGAGLDFGVTEIITASPFILYSMNFANPWPEQYNAYNQDVPAGENNSSNINQWQFGIRLIFRPDYKKNNF